jgi:hypothetical protein
MSTNVEALVLDLVEWVAKEPRAYEEVMDAWRTSCPRLTVWEDAVDRGLVQRRTNATGGISVIATDQGRALLATNRRLAAAPIRAS